MTGRLDPEHEARLRDLSSGRRLLSYVLGYSPGPAVAVLLKVAVADGGHEVFYFQGNDAQGLVACCKRHIDRFAKPPGYRSQTQWLRSHEPPLSQADFDAIGPGNLLTDIRFAETDRTMNLEFVSQDGRRRGVVIPTDIVFMMVEELRQIDTKLPRPPRSRAH